MQPDLELVQVSHDQAFKVWSHGYPYRTVRWHFHPEYELHLVTHTTGTFMVGDHAGSFEPGQLVLLGPHLPHNWISDLGPGETISERGLVLQFTRQSVSAATTAFPELQVLGPLLTEAQRGIEFGGRIGREVQPILVSLIEATGIRRVMLFLELFDRLARHQLRRSLLGPGYRPEPVGYVAGTMNHVLAHIGSHLNEDLGEVEMARMCGQSPSGFSRLFRKHTGLNFVQYVHRLRIDYACHLLMSSTKSVTDICFEVGFNNLSNFNRQFLAHKSLSPSRFRATHLTVATQANASAA